MLRTWSLVLVSSAFVLAGCPPDNNGTANNVFVPDDTGQNNNGMDAGMGDTGATNNMPDMNVMTDGGGGPADAGEDFTLPDVETEGFMHGDWELQLASGSTFVATLRLSHAEGESMMVGTYQMDSPPSFGRLAGTQWMNDIFTTSWSVDVDGSNERFNLTDCTRDGGDGQLACRYGNTLDNDIVDANLVRQ